MIPVCRSAYRIGGHLQLPEQAPREKTYKDVSENVLIWEDGIRARLWKPTTQWYQGAAVTIFAVLAAGSIVLGGYRAWNGHEAATLAYTVSWGALLGLIALGLALQVKKARRVGAVPNTVKPIETPSPSAGSRRHVKEEPERPPP